MRLHHAPLTVEGVFLALNACRSRGRWCDMGDYEVGLQGETPRSAYGLIAAGIGRCPSTTVHTQAWH